MREVTLDGMPRRLFPATPTRLTTWLDCPRKYRFTYLDRRPKGAPWAHNSVGAAAHTALHGWWSLPVGERTPAAAARLLAQCWRSDGFRDEQQSAEWRARTTATVSAYAATLDPRDEPVGVERTVAARTEVLALSGRVDRLDRRRSADGGSELVVVDYKTGRRPCSVPEAATSLALAIYTVAAARTLRQRARRVELHHLPTGTVAAHEHTPQTLERHLARADEIGTEAAAAEQTWRDRLADLAPAARDGEAHAIEAIDEAFPPRPDPRCGWCDFRAQCPEGAAVSAFLPSWAALTD